MKISKITPARKSEIIADANCPIFTKISIRANLRDYLRLEQKAKKQGLTMAAYIRQKLELTPLKRDFNKSKTI